MLDFFIRLWYREHWLGLESKKVIFSGIYFQVSLLSKLGSLWYDPEFHGFPVVRFGTPVGFCCYPFVLIHRLLSVNFSVKIKLIAFLLNEETNSFLEMSWTNIIEAIVRLPDVNKWVWLDRTRAACVWGREWCQKP